jgi:hypothetical protein
MQKFSFVGERSYKYRITPHQVLQSEYPGSYYKFRNLKVAKAFFLETLGRETKKLPYERQREIRKAKSPEGY